MSPHLKAQLLRFARFTALAFAADFLARGGQVSWGSIWTVLPGAVEAGIRQAFPVAPLPTGSAAPAPAPEDPPTPPGAS